MPDHPPFNALRVFETVARHGNFTRAAAELNMTQSAVSYQIKLVERFAATALFQREARGVSLTPAGQQIMPAIQRSLNDIRDVFRALRDDQRNLLVISTMQTIASAWLAPRIGNLQLEHPELAVRLDISSELVDFGQGTVDVAIRSGHGRWPGLASHHLIEQMFTPVASPAYLAREGRPASPGDMLSHVLIAPTDSWWNIWFKAAGIDVPVRIARPGIDVETQQMSIRVALTGHGIALATPGFVQQELDQGQLVRLFDIETTSGLSYYLVYPEARAKLRKIRLFREFVLKEAGKR